MHHNNQSQPASAIYQSFRTVSVEEVRCPRPSPIGSTRHGLLLTYTVVIAFQDEALRGLLMSWYYAGYYTGLHDGKQQQGKEHPPP